MDGGLKLLTKNIETNLGTFIVRELTQLECEYDDVTRNEGRDWSRHVVSTGLVGWPLGVKPVDVRELPVRLFQRLALEILALSGDKPAIKSLLQKEEDENLALQKSAGTG